MSETKQQAPPIADEIAVITKDVDITAGFFLDNPDPTLLTESKGKGLKLYDEVDRDAHSGSVLQTRYLAVAGEKWEVKPGVDDTKGQKIAAFVSKSLKNCNLLQAVQELLQGILYGFYVGEIIWQEKDKQIVPARILVKHPRRFGFSQARELRMLTKVAPREGEAVPERKFIVFSYGASDNPYGKALGQRLWWPVWFKKHGIKFWLVFLEKFGMPTGVGKYKSGATPEEKTTLKEAVDAIHSETGLIIPDGMIIELLEASRSGTVTYESMCDYMDRQISKAVLGQTLTTEVSGGGSYAASQTHDEVRQDIKEADAGMMAECLNETLVKWLVDYNFAGVKDYPKFGYVTEKESVLKELAERDEILVARVGVKVDDGYWYDKYNLPVPKGGAEVVTPITGYQQPQFAEQQTKKTYSPAQQALEDLAAASTAADPLAGNEKQLVQIVREASSYEEAMTKLLDFYPQLDVASLQDGLENAMVNGQLLGRRMVQDGN
jgi:phage gp29-like protein